MVAVLRKYRSEAQSTKQRKLEAANREFSPSAMELMSTPPSPVRIRMMLAISALFSVLIIIAWIGRIDIYAVAPGRVQPIGRSKVIQSLQPGKVRAIHVQNGAHVKPGDVLVELDETESVADQSTVADQLEALHAEIARRSAAISSARNKQFSALPKIKFQESVGLAARAREQAVLDAELSALRSTLDSIATNIASTIKQREGAQAAIDAEEKLIDTLTKSVDLHKSLQEKGLESMSNFIETRAALERERTSLARLTADLLRWEAQVEALNGQAKDELAKFIAENTSGLAKAQQSLGGAIQGLVKTTARVGYAQLKAPIEGTVQELTLTTIGQVVIASQQLMTIVPTQPVLEVEGMVQSKDIGFIDQGQLAKIKIDAFPYTRYGTLTGKVVRVSHDAINSREAPSLGYGSASDVTAQRSRISAMPEVQSLVFPVTIALETSTMNIDGREIVLSPGMGATIEIRTGDRRVIEYLFSPLVGTVSETGHER